jgi:serine/threonine protein kinase
LIYPLLKKLNPGANLEQSDDDLLQIFDTYASESGNADAKTSTSDLDIMRRCYATRAVQNGFKGHIVDTQTNDDGSSVDVNVPVFIKRVMFEMSRKKIAEGIAQEIAACIKREKIDYGILSKKSTDEICKLKVTFVLKIHTTVLVFVISEFCEGYNIRDFITKVFPFSIVDPSDVVKTIARKYATKFLIRLAKELLEIILWIHSNGYIYMDIRPDNFIVGVVELPRTDEMWATLFSMPRILRAIDFGGLQEFDAKLDIITSTIALKDPIMRSQIMDRSDRYFFEQFIESGLPPYNIRSIDYNNKIKQDKIFPINYNFKLDFKQTGFYFASSMIDKKPTRLKIVEALYNDIHGAWLLVLSLIWYCAPYYNALLINFIILLRGMIVGDNARSIQNYWVNDAFCSEHVLQYLQSLYTATEAGDAVLLAIDNSADEGRINELQMTIERKRKDIQDGEDEQRRISARQQEILKLKEANEAEIKENNAKINEIKTYKRHTSRLYNDISENFKSENGHPILVGGSKARRKEPVIRTVRRKTTRRRTRKRRQLKNKKKNNEN